MSPVAFFWLRLFFVAGIVLFFLVVYWAVTEETVSQTDEIDLAFACVKQAGGMKPGVTYRDAGSPLIWWTDGKTNSLLTLPLSQIQSVFDVSEHMRKSREDKSDGQS